MKKNDFRMRDVYFVSLLPKNIRLAPTLVSLAAYCVSLALIIGGQGYLSFSATETGEFEAGRVAERDVVADQAVSYINEKATREKLDSLEKQIPAVFSYSAEVTGGALDSYERLLFLVEELFATADSAEIFRAAVEEQFPGAFSRETLSALYEDPDREQFPANGLQTLQYILGEGIFSIPEAGIAAFDPQIAELRHNYGSRAEREKVAYSRVITLDKAGELVGRYIAKSGFQPGFARIGPALLEPFITENVFFSREATEQLVAELRGRAEPVMGYVERGGLVIRKGFIVTEEDMAALDALNAQARGGDPRLLIGRILIFTLVYGFIGFLLGRRIIGRLLKPSEIYLLCSLAIVYIGVSVFFKSLDITERYPAALFLPTSLVIMLPAILINLRASLAVAIALPLAAFLSGAFDSASYILALASSIAAVYAVRGAERRMDLFKAGLVVAAIQCAAATAILLIQRQPLISYPAILFWTAFNGLASGMMVLGFLPILEHALNSVTTFRLIELSDLNAPILKRLFSAAPGTYSHSLMVATLAENACQEIGANPLLARVGAYYHDIGKMENPSYFVENQTDYNRHDGINNPRLSATVIRSHVKLGVEKARSLGLPKEVVDIVAEHHGNSVISWFYNEALKREAQVDVEDFSYPGSPPRSRESAVVMLADTTEAACRTLKKPTASRLEKFIQELIMAKFEHGQLSASELTFIDLETIKNSFVRVLASHYHARIEYPKKEPQQNVPSRENAPKNPGGRE
ncbi:MAG: HDIG domain-containing protein [Spirochaetaceae bacterium]|jgi:putative nucleotidyltransferase with HDIG domain|nr:HDIG domain-containing protein [Spirochaetaceae bacterium]